MITSDGDTVRPIDRIAEAHRNGSAGEEQRRSRDARIATSFRQSDHWERVEEVAKSSPDKISPQLRIGLAHYVEARAAAARVAGGDAS